MEWNYRNPSDESLSGQNENVSISGNSWNHFALSFNKRALKIYINGIRIANIPNAKKPQCGTFVTIRGVVLLVKVICI